MSALGELLKRFQADVQTRHQRELTLQELAAGSSQEQLQLQSRIDRARAELQQQTQSIEQEFQAVRAEVETFHQQEMDRLQHHHRATVARIEKEAQQAIQLLKRQREDSEWVVESVLDDQSESSPLYELEKARTAFENTRANQFLSWSNLSDQFHEITQDLGEREFVIEAPNVEARDRDQASSLFQQEIDNANRLLHQVRSSWLAKLCAWPQVVPLLITLIAVIGMAVFSFVNPSVAGLSGSAAQGTWILISAIGGIAIGMGIFGLLHLTVSLKRSALIDEIHDAQQHAHWYHERWIELAQADLAKQTRQAENEQKLIVQQRQQALQRFQNAQTQQQRQIETDGADQIESERQRFESELSQTASLRDEQIATIENEFQQRLQAGQASSESELNQLEEQWNQLRSEQSRKQSELWMELKSDWEQSTQRFLTEFDAIDESSRRTHLPWDTLAQGDWTPPEEIPSNVMFGSYPIDLHQWPLAVSEDMRLAPRRSILDIPSVLEFPGAAATLFKSETPEARSQAHLALQTMMLRLLLSLPPGKIRFTMIDPIGLGETFGGFMHLADYDELMVTNRIWTEAGQIENRLADLTEHMENVFQTYLRNEFQTIEEYNKSAGEVAEPYHFLVISDFPTKFSEIAARRLVSIVNSGPRCGVYTLMNLDPTKQFPNQFELSDIESLMSVYEWKQSHFHSTEEILAPWAIEIQQPPDPERFTSIVKMVGEASKDARRVEVGFHRIAPDAGQIWSCDSRSELEIPLGRSGATKLQRLRLGKGTSQHMLVAGKTGSGKSTFLHILITNLGLYYHPDEVNFFLIDFKKGVEFKDYSTYQLPHARVIAIESDREFGVSVLQRLDEILQERGELFRRHGVHDIAAYRNANPQEALPRLLLIVDEFQEFFVEDDKLSQTAALFLDRLVRQGRAFGIHVILGSQTLGGAYSLARTTLGQVAVRVALQCSETDAHLILSEENTAARLLTRPGEAIFNDANGMMEGNHPFQIAWISDEERAQWLQKIHQKSARAGIEVEPPIVFEGNIPSDLRGNVRLRKLAEAYFTRSEPITAPTVWLGDAVEIKPSTDITFHRQSGSHLLIVGQDNEAALGIMIATALGAVASSALVSSGAQGSPGPLVIFDGSPAETDEALKWKAFTASMPGEIPLVKPKDARSALEQLTEELQSRLAEPDEARNAIIVLVHNLSKFRDLRKGEDDFGLGGFGSSSEEKPAEPGKLFSKLLEEGPEVGIHFVLWCDSNNNVDRWLSRQSQKELEQRVLFQMNAADSSQLIDSPAASRLGSHRALLYREETGLAEKFRPYGPPSDQFLREFGQLLKSGTHLEIATDLEEFSIM